MHFEALYYRDRLVTVNPEGDVGIVTLWSKVESAIQLMGEARIDLSPDSSRVVAIGNLYGNGLPHMLRNLLWNPQVRYVVIMGKDLSGSRQWLINFFEHGLEEVEFLGSRAFRIKGTSRTIDGEIRPEHFRQKISFEILGDIGSSETRQGLMDFFSNLGAKGEGEVERFTPPPIPEPTITRFPSEPRGHTIIRRTPMEAWTELIFHLCRFGYRNEVVKKGGKETRIELQNTHVVVTEPTEEPAEVLEEFGFDLEHFRDYQKRFLDPFKPSDLPYTYGNRLRSYFEYGGQKVDSLAIVGERLRKSPDSRHAYISTWDNSLDLPTGSKCPCFVSAFLRNFDGKLTLTATFRTHNAMDGWPENLYGLMAVQKYVARIAELETGAITVISHSISIDPASLSKAQRIMERKKTDEVLDQATGKWGPRMDPNGAFTVTIDASSGEIVVEHSFGGMRIGEYRGRTAVELEKLLARDCALSVISHALYLGREIAKAEMNLRKEK